MHACIIPNQQCTLQVYGKGGSERLMVLARKEKSSAAIKYHGNLHSEKKKGRRL